MAPGAQPTGAAGRIQTVMVPLRSALGAVLALVPLLAGAAGGEDGAIEIRRTAAEIIVDGRLGDPGWNDATLVDRWYETRPGDNVEPKVANRGYLVYDGEFLYAAFEFADPEPRRIHAPLGNRDDVPSYTDYGGLIIDANDDRRSAQLIRCRLRRLSLAQPPGAASTSTNRLSVTGH